MCTCLLMQGPILRGVILMYCRCTCSCANKFMLFIVVMILRVSSIGTGLIGAAANERLREPRQPQMYIVEPLRSDTE